MVPDIEREWIAEESRTVPQPVMRLVVTLIVLLAIGWAIYRWLG
jgi:hypothetical protein